VRILVSYREYSLPRILHIFSEYNQQDATFLNLFISVRRSTCFGRVFRPSSGAQNCTYSVRYLSDRYCYLLLAAGSSNGRKTHLNHAERLTEKNKLRNVASCWLYSAHILAMHGHMNVKLHILLLVCVIKNDTNVQSSR